MLPAVEDLVVVGPLVYPWIGDIALADAAAQLVDARILASIIQSVIQVRTSAIRAGPCCSSALAIIATSVPASNNFIASAPSWTPGELACERAGRCATENADPVERQPGLGDVESCSRGVTSRVSRSMSGWYSRLNKTNPSAPDDWRATAK